MGNDFTLDDLAHYAARRWQVVAAACLIAAIIAAAISFNLPKEYTAVTRVIVEPGPANPVRNASPESPQMLGVLGGYDQLIHADRLFADVTALVGSGISKSDLATRVLAASRVIEIRFTHTSPAKAFEVVSAVAHRAVEVSDARRMEAVAEIEAEAGARQHEARTWAVFRGERLRVLDEGVVPAAPSSPRTLLNIMGAALLALALSSVTLALGFLFRDAV